MAEMIVWGRSYSTYLRIRFHSAAFDRSPVVDFTGQYFTRPTIRRIILRPVEPLCPTSNEEYSILPKLGEDEKVTFYINDQKLFWRNSMKLEKHRSGNALTWNRRVLPGQIGYAEKKKAGSIYLEDQNQAKEIIPSTAYLQSHQWT